MFKRLFGERHEPLFLNEGPFQSERMLQEMEALLPQVHWQDKSRLERDIKLQKAGIAGEKRILFELMNSHYPLVVIHDLNLEHEGVRAQIDFLVISPSSTFIIECKNLIGDVEIDKDGSFFRVYKSKGRRHREGFYSPATQNTRHIELMRAIMLEGRNAIMSVLSEKFLKHFYQSLIVFTNDRTVISMSHAPEEIRRQIIRSDQLVAHIKQHDKASKKWVAPSLFKEMKEEADMWLSYNEDIELDLSDKYRLKTSPSQARPTAQPDEPYVMPDEEQPATDVGDQHAMAVQGATAKEGRNAAQDHAPDPSQPPLCPLCGSPMVLRTAHRGARKGKQFWGCSNYWSTRCKGVINID